MRDLEQVWDADVFKKDDGKRLYGPHNTLLLDSDESKLQLATPNSLVIDSFERNDVWLPPELAAKGEKRRDQAEVLASI